MVDCKTKNVVGTYNMYRSNKKNKSGPGQLKYLVICLKNEVGRGLNYCERTWMRPDYEGSYSNAKGYIHFSCLATRNL